jgi:TetR/AcrR family transcriptional repressor of nem operon
MDEWLALTRGLAGDDAFARLLRAYVSRSHRDRPEVGCCIAAIGTDAARSAEELRDVFQDGVTQFLDVLTSVSEGGTAAERRRKAIGRAAAMVGAIIMARAASADPTLSDEILKAVRAELLSHP